MPVSAVRFDTRAFWISIPSPSSMPVFLRFEHALRAPTQNGVPSPWVRSSGGADDLFLLPSANTTRFAPAAAA